MAAILEKFEKISKKKSDLLEVEKKLKFMMREREKRKRIKMSIAIGKLACKAEIDALNHQVLLGAFLEIAERSNDQKELQKWEKLSEKYTKSQNGLVEKLLSIKVQTEIDPVLKQKLKELGFVWNKFRKEFYGSSDKKTLETLFKGLDYIIEELE